MAKNFGRLAIDAQRVALSEMIAVYKGGGSTIKKAPKKAKKVEKVKKAAKKQMRSAKA